MFTLRRLTPNVGHLARTCFVIKSRKGPTIDELSITKQITSQIKLTGPITVAEYMKQILTSPFGGYYMHKDGIGATGDFITSPELSQMFGEMIAIWFLNEWSKFGTPKPLQIVELGPGRGSLSQDILRVFAHFDAVKATSLNLVEISPVMSDLQAKLLCLQTNVCPDNNSVVYREGISHQGVPVKWFRHLDDVPGYFTLLIAHEFFDALPVHKFVKTDHGYREVLIDIDEQAEGKFRYIIARESTPMSKLLIKPNETREHVEVSPESLILIEKICKRIEQDGGLALIADYGHLGEKTDTFRAFKHHQLHDPLVEPGSADLTADVDFGRLKNTADKCGGILTLGPVTQHDFLENMGIEHRFKVLEAGANDTQKESLQLSYDMIVNPDKMGERFKFMGIIPKTVEKIINKFPVVGFNNK